MLGAGRASRPAPGYSVPTVNAPELLNCTVPLVELIEAVIPVPLKPLLSWLMTVLPLIPLAPPLSVTVRDCAFPLLSV